MSYFSEIYKAELPHRAVAVYMYLKDRSGKNGNCWPAISTMSKDLGLSRSTVKRALDDLERNRFITKDSRFRQNGGCTSNMYTIL